ncbi:expressed unknown protein [Seminavis robusta]|uniref:Uncharacterized protein n=1 Tax=Seminavis robusta TaxID=568900 RepID=A0A9N8HJV9_9STRA|nr:expressed unknown protein [Seminavis robusta]|eukprot:Sro690_g187660.1 n/a (77) ;mRNA; f:33936-34166
MPDQMPPNTGLNDSVSNMTQTTNQGMGAVGDCAADIEIYMGEQSSSMATENTMQQAPKQQSSTDGKNGNPKTQGSN